MSRALSLVLLLLCVSLGGALARSAPADTVQADAFSALPRATRLEVMDLASHTEFLHPDERGNLALDSQAALADGFSAQAVGFLADYYAAQPTSAAAPDAAAPSEPRQAVPKSVGSKLAKVIAKAIVKNKSAILRKLEALLGRAIASKYVPLDRLVAILEDLVTVDNTVDAILGTALRLLLPTWMFPVIPGIVFIIRLFV